MNCMFDRWLGLGPGNWILIDFRSISITFGSSDVFGVESFISGSKENRLFQINVRIGLLEYKYGLLFKMKEKKESSKNFYSLRKPFYVELGFLRSSEFFPCESQSWVEITIKISFETSWHGYIKIFLCTNCFIKERNAPEYVI